MKNKKDAPAVRSKIWSKLMSASCVCYSDRACYWVCRTIFWQSHPAIHTKKKLYVPFFMPV